MNHLKFHRHELTGIENTWMLVLKKFIYLLRWPRFHDIHTKWMHSHMGVLRKTKKKLLMKYGRDPQEPSLFFFVKSSSEMHGISMDETSSSCGIMFYENSIQKHHIDTWTATIRFIFALSVNTFFSFHTIFISTSDTMINRVGRVWVHRSKDLKSQRRGALNTTESRRIVMKNAPKTHAS